MEEAPENGKGSSHSAHANGMNECMWSLKKAESSDSLVTFLSVATRLHAP